MIEHNQDLNIEQDFWSDFVQEAFEHIEEIETNVISLEQNPDDMEIIHTMFRAFHTIKGLSGFVEHTIIQEIAHGTETLMDYCRKGELKVNSKIVDAILKSADYIKRLCDEVESYNDNNFIDQINRLLEVLEELANVEDASVKAPEAFQSETTVEVETQPELFAGEAVDEVEAEFVSESQGLDAFAAIPLGIGDEEETKEEIPEEIVLPVAEETPEQVADKAIQEFLKGFAASSEPVVEIIGDVITEPETILAESFEVPTEEVAEVASESDAVKEGSQELIPEVKSFEPVFEQTIAPKFEQVVQPAAQRVDARQESAVAVKLEANPSEATPVKKVFAPTEEHMKVANTKIDHLVEMIGELIINQSLIEQYISSNYSQDNQLMTNMSGFLRITRELQSLSMSLRMVSLKPTFQKISRIARDTIQELGRDVEFVTTGENTEIDRVVTDKLLDPLVHLIKNAISHGVEENGDDRLKYGKCRKARVELNAYNKRGKIFIEVKDDGCGIDTEIVYQKALEKGVIDRNRVYSQEEIKEFILLPGFSTAKVVDNISGRGVGMDVVKTQILKIGGKIDIKSELRKGSTFTLEVPVNHAIMNGTIVDIRGQHFIIPTINVKEILQPQDKQWIFTQQKRTMLRVREDIIPLVPISLFFKGAKLEEHVPLVMLLEVDGELKALPITNVVNRQEVVVKPVGEEFLYLKYISGMSILGTGKVSLILDVDYLFKKEVKE